MKCLVGLAQKSNEHSNTFGTSSTKLIYYSAFCCQDAAARWVPQGLPGQGQASRTNPIIPARSRASRALRAAPFLVIEHLSGDGPRLSHSGSSAWGSPWPRRAGQLLTEQQCNPFSLFCLVIKTNTLFYWLLGPKNA